MNKGIIKSLAKNSSTPSIVLFLLVVLLNGMLSSKFFSPGSMISLMQTTMPIIIISIGMAMVMIGGGIDLSVGAIISVVNVIIASQSGGFSQTAVQYEATLILKPLIISFIVAAGFGIANGFLVSVLRIPALLATFSTSFIGQGIALTILPVPGGAVPDRAMDFYYGTFLGFIPNSVIFALIITILWYVLGKTSFRVKLDAAGHNEYKAFFSGINVNRLKFFTYLYSAFAGWLAGICVSYNFGGGDPRVGNAMTLSAVAACVVGGISMSGGSGNMVGAIFGALFMNLIILTVMGLGISTYLQELVNGSLVVIGILVAMIIQKRTKRI